MSSVLSLIPRVSMWSQKSLSLLFRTCGMQIRCLNLLECHSKSLLNDFGITVQQFRIIEKADDTKKLEQDFKVNEYVIKAQVLAGGRGLGHFDNGFKGGVHLTKDPKELDVIVRKMVGHRLITKQTNKKGILVKKVMVAESVNIKRETYFCILMDRGHNGPVIIASPAGGTDIETVAKDTPHLLGTYPIDIYEGVSHEKAMEIAKFLQFKGDYQVKCAEEVKRLWKLFIAVDATQVEINPLCETDDGRVVAVDAKIQFDDNAKFRQSKIFLLDETDELDPRELMASKFNLNYIGLDGNVGCLVNGAGLAMATMDIIKLHKGSPANFLDVGGGVNEDQVFEAFNILTSDPNVKSILVNVFGGIVDCGIIARGIVNATTKMQLNVPLTVRLEGTNVEKGKAILFESKLPITFATDLDQAAEKVIASMQ